MTIFLSTSAARGVPFIRGACSGHTPRSWRIGRAVKTPDFQSGNHGFKPRMRQPTSSQARRCRSKSIATQHGGGLSWLFRTAVSSPACHAGGHGFESRKSRLLSIPRQTEGEVLSTVAEVKALKDVMETGGYFIEEETAMKIFLATKYRGKGLSTVLLSGPAGSGKTALVETLAGIIGAHLEIYQGVPTTSEEALIFDIDIAATVAKDTANINKKGKLIRAVENAAKHFSILFLDEWEKTRPEMDSFLLDFLQSGRLTGTPLGDFQVQDLSKLIVFIAKNDDRELSEPLMRRCRDVPLSLPRPDLARQVLKRVCALSDPMMMGWILRLYAKQYQAQAKFRKVATIQEMINALLDDDLLRQGYDLEHRKQNAVSWLASYRDDKELFEPMVKSTAYKYPKDIYDELGLPDGDLVDAATLVRLFLVRLRNPQMAEQKRRFIVWCSMFYLMQLEESLDRNSKMKPADRIPFGTMLEKIRTDSETKAINTRLKAFFWGVDKKRLPDWIAKVPRFITAKGEQVNITLDMVA